MKHYSISLFLYLIAFLIIPISGYSQVKIDTTATFQKERLNPGLGKKVFTKENLLVFGGLLGTSFLLDEWSNKRLKLNQNSFLDSYTNIFNEFGEKKYIAPATFAAWVIGTAIKDERLSTTALNSGKALITAAILTEGTKIIAGRSRPDMNRGNMHFDAFGGKNNDTKSFPSGHAFVSWAVFTPFAEEYSKWIYVIPASVSFARMYKNRHWFSDVVLGGGIGYFAGLYFHKRKNQSVIFDGNGIIIKF
ncbi:phosphatase PAP2 family protein [Labilibaculum antarcticum]|uniref:Phosphatase PAP2 family protein n=1 Tax=Labilibaculum antarcticum TaxID=1717717 RepID=A0A1Y1CHU8_9BACT|nr:phosphatase PAP2 family protein [Labilibaculum antarcticum]BAX79870.1 phosphatase PAP2 family protein [Labilibaculum antarcticum]